MTPTAKRAVVECMVAEHHISRSKACRIVGFSRSALYKPTVDWAAKDAPVIAVLKDIGGKRSRWDFWKCFHRLRADGHDQNAFIERFNKSFRTEVLDANLFNSISEVQMVADVWLMDYNEYRPHESPGDVPPVAYMPRVLKLDVSSFKLST